MDLKDILSKPRPVREDWTDVQYISALWRAAVSERTAVFQPAFTPKTVGQLKHIVRKLVAVHQKPAVVLPLVAREWESFTACVKSIHNPPDIPQHPDIGFVLRHIDILIEMPV